jgi:hypothetical protein
LIPFLRLDRFGLCFLWHRMIRLDRSGLCFLWHRMIRLDRLIPFLPLIRLNLSVRILRLNL